MGKLNPSYKDGRTNKKHYCKDCHKLIHYTTASRGKRCISCARQGKNNPNWLGGLSQNGYSYNFDTSLKNVIRSKDNYTCQICLKAGKYVHHIDYNKKNNNHNNLITLCLRCHIKTNYNRDCWKNYFQNKTYKQHKTPIIVYTSGSFDILNEGHINILEKAKNLGDFLIVGVSTNKLIKSYKHIYPIMNLKERIKIIKSLKFVDKVIKQKKFFDITQLKKYKISIIVLGSDWEKKEFPELSSAIKKLKYKMIYLPYTKSTSSSNIKRRIIKQAVEILESQTRRAK
jgi:glycerol-3-phosphate cytidylyltransferase